MRLIERDNVMKGSAPEFHVVHESCGLGYGLHRSPLRLEHGAEIA
jgi:hypothetical protein